MMYIFVLNMKKIIEILVMQFYNVLIYPRDFSPVLNKIFGNEKGSTNYDN